MENDPNKISVKVNGKDRPVTEGKEEQEVAAAIDRESIDTPFDWVLPKEKNNINAYFFQQNRNENQIDDHQPISYDRKPGLPIHRKKQRMSFKGQLPTPKMPFQFPKKLLIPIASAIVIGCMIGLIVLMIFTGKEFQSQTEPTAIAPGSQGPLSKDTPAPSTNATTVDLSVAPYIVQGGLFSTNENAQEFVDNVQSSGYAAVIDPEDNRVLIGVGGSMEDARGLADEYQSIVSDAYPKEWPVDGKEITVSDENQLQWLVEGKSLFEKLIAAEGSQVNGMESSLLAWKKDALASVSALTKEQQQMAIAFINSLSTISESTGNQWEFQQAKIEAVIHYKTLLAGL